MVLKKFTNFLLELFFPKFCFNCRAEGDYLCQDCQATLEIAKQHQPITPYNSNQNLKDLYFAVNYQSPLIKNLIQKFKYEPFVKKLAKPLSALIIEHFQLLDNKPPFFASSPTNPQSEYILIPVPLDKKKLKRRGFNQAEEIGKELSSFLAIPLIPDCLIKIKETIPQVKLTAQTRKKNVKGAFFIKNKNLVKDKKILLVDDVYTTGSTMEEAARVLKVAGAKEIIGIVVARAKPGQDYF
ncbi:MAG: ComF family protein [Patescibacteria group bacterium]|nr:ComF family protein [Patescibacteria group bacterium]